MKTSIILLGLLFFTINTLCSQDFNGNKEDIQVILENTKKFSKYVMASDYKKIGDSYTKDAKIFPNNKKILSGDQIISYWTLPEDISISYHKIFQNEITIVENTAYDYGYYEGKTKKSNDKEISWKGKYVIVWKKIDNDWKMYLDIWNSVSKK